jgi:hypothetical protein
MATQAQISPDPKLVLSKTVLKAARMLGVSQEELEHIVGKNRTTITRGVNPQSKTGELALMLVRCYSSISVLVGGGEAEIKHWFTTSNKYVGGTPKDMVKSVQGLVTVTQYLDAIRG